MDEEEFDKQREINAEELLGQVSRQLRLSLGNIHSALERLAPMELREGDPKADRYAAILCQSYYRVLRLTNNLSEAANFNAPMRLRRENCDVVGLCRGMAERTESLAELVGLRLEFDSDCEHQIISMDRERVEHLLLNLLSNAFKYTPAGGTVRIEVRVDRQQVRLCVSDTGCGMSAEERETVYERYRHPPAADGRSHGLGLGLPLCRRVAEEHGGSIVLLTEEGKGTAVTVSLPNRRERHVVVNDYVVDMAGGFNRTLVELADALPKEAFTHQYLD